MKKIIVILSFICSGVIVTGQDQTVNGNLTINNGGIRLKSSNVSDPYNFISFGDTNITKWLIDYGTGATQDFRILKYNSQNSASTFLNLDFANNQFEILNSNVGIGVTNPSSKLEVKGVIKTVHTDGRYVNLFTSGDGNSYMNIAGGSASSRFGFQVDGSSKMSIMKNGNIGIGTSAADQKFVVNGNIAFSYNNTISANGFRRNGIKTEYYNLITGVDSNVIHEFTGTNKTIMSLNQGGNVGIGSTSPGSKLVVQANTGETESLAQFRVADAPSDYFQITNATGSPNQFIPLIKGHHVSDNRYSLQISGTTSEANDAGGNALVNFDARRTNGPIQARPLFTWTSYTTKMMTMTANGNLGIGTTNPDAKLAVKGRIHTQEVKVDLNGAVAPDYVFLEDYDLKTINEVESYIEKEGHLPNIPSAKEMEQNGIELKTMNLKLLEKIEELTLYMIEQNKKTELLRQEIVLLKEKNKELEGKIK